jgi:hypothetical protein
MENRRGLVASPSSASASYELVRSLAVPHKHTDRYQRCPGSHPHYDERLDLPNEIREQPGLLDFFPRWDLMGKKVVVVGDLIAMQISQAVNEAARAPERRTIRKDVDEQEWTYASHPGGQEKAGLAAGEDGTHNNRGLVAGLRLQNLFLESSRETGRPRSSNKWNIEVIRELLRHPVSDRKPSLSIGRFDVMVQRIPLGRISLGSITPSTLRENAIMASDLLGIHTLILFNLPMNVKAAEYEGEDGYLALWATRQMFRDFAEGWKPQRQGSENGLQRVLVLELGDLVDDLLDWNARIMDSDASLPCQDWMLCHTPAVPGSSQVAAPKQLPRRLGLERQSRSEPDYSSHKIAQASVPDSARPCPRDMMTYDGTHLSMSTLGGRIVAGMACLTDCAMAADEAHGARRDVDPPKLRDAADRNGASLNSEGLWIRQCEARCNRQFMSVVPVPEAELVLT